MRDATDAPRPADFDELWREWHPRAAAYCRAFSGLSPEAREELASEALFRAWAARDGFEPGKPFAPWFLTIVRHLALDELARQGREVRRDGGVDEAASTLPEAERLLERDCEASFVRAFLAGRDRLDRELASLVYGQGLKPGEAARTLGIRAGTAGWRLHRLRAALKKAWERDYGN